MTTSQPFGCSNLTLTRYSGVVPNQLDDWYGTQVRTCLLGVLFFPCFSFESNDSPNTNTHIHTHIHTYTTQPGFCKGAPVALKSFSMSRPQDADAGKKESVHSRCVIVSHQEARRHMSLPPPLFPISHITTPLPPKSTSTGNITITYLVDDFGNAETSTSAGGKRSNPPPGQPGG